jgi:hypothetical protein
MAIPADTYLTSLLGVNDFDYNLVTGKPPAFTGTLQQLLLCAYSRSQRDRIANEIGSEPDRLHAAIYILFHGTPDEMKRIVWAISKVADDAPENIKPWLPLLVKRLLLPAVPDVIKRQITRILANTPIPEHLHPKAIDLTLGYLARSEEPIAVRAFSIATLEKLSLVYPDLEHELRELLALALENSPAPGIKSKAQNVLSRLTKRHKA